MEASTDQDIMQSLTELEHSLARAWVERDRAFIEAALAEDWIVTDLTGQLLTKDEVIKEAFSAGEREVVSMIIDDIRVRPFRDWAVVTGRTKASGRYQKQIMEVTLRFTDVFELRHGRWQAIASHATLLAGDK